MSLATQEVQINVRSDFDPLRDRVRFMERTIDAEQTKVQIETFLKEYITNLTTSHYSYVLGPDGKFGVKGWARPLEESYRDAITAEGIEFMPDQQAQRFAEYNSYMQIQKDSLKNPHRKKVLISPDRGYGYNYVSFYTPKLNEQGEFEVGVSIHRVWKKFQSKSHDEVKQSWINDPRLDVRVMHEQFANRELFEQLTPEAQGIFNTNHDIHNILNQAISIDTKGQNITDEELLASYYNNGVDTLINSSIIDRQIQAQLQDFEPEVLGFRDLLIAQKPDYLTEEQYSNQLNVAFKELLVKAKVHFDEEAAEAMWGAQAVQDIKSGTITKTKDLAGFNYKSASGVIKDLEIIIQGSCGKVAIGEATFDQILGAFKVNDGIGRALGENTKFVCDACGEHHVISAQNNLLISNCHFCGKSVRC